MKRYLKTPEEVVQALKDGKTVEDKDYKYRLVSGIICSVDKEEEQKGCSNWAIGEAIFKWAKPYVMEPEVLKLEVGKFYKTRDGRKASVLNVVKDDTISCPVRVVVVDNNYEPYFIRKSGRLYKNEENAWDIVAPWEE